MTQEREHKGKLYALDNKDLMQLQYSLCKSFQTAHNRGDAMLAEQAKLAEAIITVNDTIEKRLDNDCSYNIKQNRKLSGTTILEHAANM